MGWSGGLVYLPVGHQSPKGGGQLARQPAPVGAQGLSWRPHR
jgi:hypothetical protein